MKRTEISQGPWTRIRPLQRDEIDPYTLGAMASAEANWGMRNNELKVTAYCPGILQTGIDHANSFILDPPTFRGDVQEAAFNDRFVKELVISRIALIMRSRYPVTHHGYIGVVLYTSAGRGDEGHQKYLHLHEHEKHPGIYTERERVVLDYTAKVTRNTEPITDEEFAQLQRVLHEHNDQDARLKGLPEDEMDRYVDRQIVELTWLIGHCCGLNRWFSTLQVPDEGPDDEYDFLAAYEEVVPEDIRKRNERVLGGRF
ncbi:MAG: hypothetical protein JSU63_10805 [Phycisphaerales bacterium]|nr:MAG: hypothetical protein JSU63_10805 [Phycisphaerales bacterium]